MLKFVFDHGSSVFLIKTVSTFGSLDLFKNGPSQASLSFIFGLFQSNINTVFQHINVKNVHPVYSAGIWTHDPQNVSLLPKELDQGSRLLFVVIF